MASNTLPEPEFVSHSLAGLLPSAWLILDPNTPLLGGEHPDNKLRRLMAQGDTNIKVATSLFNDLMRTCIE